MGTSDIGLINRKIDENYDNIEEYLYKEFNLTQEDIKQIRDNYLE